MKTAIKLSLFALAGLISVANAAPLAEGGAKFLGNITTGGQVRSDMGTYWNQITAENECKWGSINTAEDRYNWSGCDAAYNWAKNNGYHFKFHALVWGSQYPNWIKSLSAERTAEVIEKWMKAVADHYGPMGGIEMIDVVNEAIRTGNNQYHSGYTDTKIIQALGGDNGKYTFVANAFKMAKKYFPNSILIYNDYNTIRWNIDEGIDLIKRIKEQGAPVDAYGQQAHDISGMSESDFKNALTKIHNQTQLPIYITEYDVGSDDDDYQLESYKAHIPFLWETPWIAGITLWGYVNGSTWINVDAKKADQCKANGGGWQECENNNPCKGCSGLITGSGDRKAMTWLKQYFSQHLADGQNTTGLSGGTTIEPEPRQYFNGQPFNILNGKIEAEHFDIPGKGVNQDGTSNMTYSDSDSENHGKSTLRPDAPDVDIYEKSFGTVIGYNAEGEWYEYTINVPETGDYTLYVAAAAASNTSSFQFSLDGKTLTDVINVPSATAGEDNYEEFNKVKIDVNFSKTGTHTLRLTVTGAWFDIDYFNFVKGKNAEDDAPINSSESNDNSSGSSDISSSSNSTISSNSIDVSSNSADVSSNSGDISSNSTVVTNPENSSNSSNGNTPVPPTNGEELAPASFTSIHMNVSRLVDYDLIDVHGVRLGRLSAYALNEAVTTIKNSNLVKSSGIYYLRSRTTGKIQSLRITR